MERTEMKNGLVSLTCDGSHILHRKGSGDYQEIRRVTVPEAVADEWEEIEVAEVPPYSKDEYDAMVARLIRRRYTADEEFALQRKMLTAMLHPEAATLDETGETAVPVAVTEFEAYAAFAEQCKARAKDPTLYRPEDTVDMMGTVATCSDPTAIENDESNR